MDAELRRRVPALPVVAMLFAIGGAILVTLGRYPSAPPARR
jgi:hypothetical protein